MASQKQPTQQEVVQAIFAYAMELKASGLTKWQIEAKLVEKGLDREAASTVTNKIFNPSPNFASSSRGQMRYTAPQRRSGSSGFTNMLIGGGLAVAGIVVTLYTYSAASEGGGRYVVWWGAVIFGGIQFFKGLGQFMSGD